MERIEIRRDLRPRDRTLHIGMETLSEMLGIDDHEFTIVSGYWDHERDSLVLVVTNPHLIPLTVDATKREHSIGVVTGRKDMDSVMTEYIEYEEALKDYVRGSHG